MERASLEFDVAIVSAGPSSLSTAIRLKQLAAGAGQALNAQNCVHCKTRDNSA